MDERLMWHGIARHGAPVTSAVHEAIARAGAWIERSEMYSNLSVCLVIGMDAEDVASVAAALASVPGFEPSAKTRQALARLAGASIDARTEVASGACEAAPCALVTGRPWAPRGDAREVFATLALTYPRGDGSLARERAPG